MRHKYDKPLYHCLHSGSSLQELSQISTEYKQNNRLIKLINRMQMCHTILTPVLIYLPKMDERLS